MQVLLTAKVLLLHVLLWTVHAAFAVRPLAGSKAVTAVAPLVAAAEAVIVTVVVTAVLVRTSPKVGLCDVLEVKTAAGAA